jgi:2-oxoglutarate dehydrogenase E2 component (dihydrolipoamide succinyltransferase)
VTKKDILAYVSNRSAAPAAAGCSGSSTCAARCAGAGRRQRPTIVVSGGVEIVEMDRMRKLIADHMVMSKQTSAHVTSFVEADVTNLVNWRNQVKDQFKKKYGENITFTPIFVEAVARAIRDFPMINHFGRGYADPY